MSEELPTVTIDAHGVGETLTLAAPQDWHDRIRALSRWTRYGPDHRPAVVENLDRMSRALRHSDPTAGYHWLLLAERAAGPPADATAEDPGRRGQPDHR